MIYLAAEQIIGINARHLGGQPAVRDAGQVASAAMRPQTVVFGKRCTPRRGEGGGAAALLDMYAPIRRRQQAHSVGGRPSLRHAGWLEFTLSHDEAFDLVTFLGSHEWEPTTRQMCRHTNAVVAGSGPASGIASA